MFYHKKKSNSRLLFHMLNAARADDGMLISLCLAASSDRWAEWGGVYHFGSFVSGDGPFLETD